jgi:hypothetical protein
MFLYFYGLEIQNHNLILHCLFPGAAIINSTFASHDDLKFTLVTL